MDKKCAEPKVNKMLAELLEAAGDNSWVELVGYIGASSGNTIRLYKKLDPSEYVEISKDDILHFVEESDDSGDQTKLFVSSSAKVRCDCEKGAGQDTIQLDGASGDALLGGNGQDGDVIVRDSAGQETIRLDGAGGNALLGGNGKDGDVVLFPSSASNQSDWSQATIHLDANTGDIRLSGADCAEHFDVVKDAAAEAGTVLIMGQSGALQPCDKAYDKRVAGVVSGAGSYRPGVILDGCGPQEGRVAVALMGKVFCKVDATACPIEVGDLLTTSATPGHAMKAADATKAFGAVIGKAMRAQPSGKDVIPILACLQ